LQKLQAIKRCPEILTGICHIAEVVVVVQNAGIVSASRSSGIAHALVENENVSKKEILDIRREVPLVGR
jgi:hypothetical protein